MSGNPAEHESYCWHSFYLKLLNFHVFQFNTVKFLNFRTPENFAVFYLKFEQRGQTLGYFFEKDANRIANSEDPDQTAPLGAI